MSMEFPRSSGPHITNHSRLRSRRGVRGNQVRRSLQPQIDEGQRDQSHRYQQLITKLRTKSNHITAFSSTLSIIDSLQDWHMSLEDSNKWAGNELEETHRSTSEPHHSLDDEGQRYAPLQTRTDITTTAVKLNTPEGTFEAIVDGLSFMPGQSHFLILPPNLLDDLLACSWRTAKTIDVRLTGSDTSFQQNQIVYHQTRHPFLPGRPGVQHQKVVQGDGTRTKENRKMSNLSKGDRMAVSHRHSS